MTVTLDIPQNMEAVLTEKAAQQGQTVNDYLLALVETGLYEEYEMSEQEREDEAVILQTRMQDRQSGDKGILLEDYWAGVIRKRQARIVVSETVA